jgi:oligosaccharide repeat unit polymerase
MTAVTPDSNHLSIERTQGPGIKIGLALTSVLLLLLWRILQDAQEFRFSTLLLLIASVFFVAAGTRRQYDLFHPIRVFGALWCLCLGLASMRLLPLNSEWDFFMWACVLTALVTFVGGFWLGDQLVRRHSGGPMEGPPKELTTIKSLPDRKTLLVSLFCLAIGLAVLAYEYSLIGVVPVLSENVDFARSQLFGLAGQGDPKFDTLWIKLIHPIVDFIKYAVFLACIILFRKEPKSRKVVVTSLVVIVMGVLAYISQGGRSFLVAIVITIVALFHYLRRNIRLTEFAVAAVALFLIVGTLGVLRVRQSASAPLFEKAVSNSNFPEGVFWDGVAFGYGGCTLSLEVFYRLTQDLPSTARSSGYLFYAFHRFVPREDLGEVAMDLYSGELVTATFLGEFYADYGYWGILFGPLILGFGYGWVYQKGEGQGPIYWLYVRALLVEMLVFFPYVNLFSHYLNWIFDLFFMYILIRCIRERPSGEMTPAAVAA